MGKFIISEEEKNSIRSMYNLNEQEEIKLQDFINKNKIDAFEVDGEKIYFTNISDLETKLTKKRGGSSNYAIAVVGIDNQGKKHKLKSNYALQKSGERPLELTVSFD